jgi:hypothetical protein
MLFSRGEIYAAYIRTFTQRFTLKTILGLDYRFDYVEDRLEVHLQGTTTKSDWFFNFWIAPTGKPDGQGLWAAGFNAMALSVIPKIREELQGKDPALKVVIVGFSQGGAVAERVGQLMGLPVISIGSPCPMFLGKRRCEGVKVALAEDIVAILPFFPFHSAIKEVITLHRESGVKGIVNTHLGYTTPMKKWADFLV